MAIKEKEEPRHRVLREIYRHYLEFRDLVTKPEYDGQGGYGNLDGVIDYGYYVREGDGLRKVLISLSFWDLHDALHTLSERKREAILHNVIFDKKQKDVAEIMGITTVSVGQYVEQGMLQLADGYFAELGVAA